MSELLKPVDIKPRPPHRVTTNENMIGYNEIAFIKSDTFKIHTSRGGLIDKMALLDALKSCHIKGAGLIVFSEK